MFDGTKVRTEKIGDRKVDIKVTDSGKFGATFGEGDERDDYFADSLADLLTKLKAADKASRPSTAVKVTLVDWNTGWRGEGKGRGVLNAIFRGRNQRTRAWLMTDEATGKKFSVDGYGSNRRHYARRLTDDEVAEYQRLSGEADAAAARLDQFLGGVAVDPDDLVKAAAGEDSADS